MSPSGHVTLLDWSFPGAARVGGAERVVVLLPDRPIPTPTLPENTGATPLAFPSTPVVEAAERFPVLVALHGRGEAVRGAEAGAYGWVRDYHLPQQIRALAKGALTAEDFFQLIAPERLHTINISLAKQPFGGLIVVCPHTPDILNPGRDLAAAAPFGRWLVETLLPRVYQECPAQVDATGIDGVSLGGRVALLVGTAHPMVFRSVGTLQPAFQASEAAPITARAQGYLATRPAGKLRLLTSEGDFFRTAVAALHQAFLEAGVPHEHMVALGPHDYVFNRGPGGLEMLFWHDRVLRT